MSGIRREMAKIYRQTRRKQVDIADATRYAYLLRVLAEMIASELIERRLDNVEAKARDLDAKSGLGIRTLSEWNRKAA
jgi:hypothetical protein